MKLMDNWEGGSLKNLFTTKSEPEPYKEGGATAPQNVIEVSHNARRSGETYKQYGVRVAGLSEGSIHTLQPCLQSVYFGIRREQEEDAGLQEELSKKLKVQITELESNKENIKSQIADLEKHQTTISDEIEENKKKLADLEEGKSIKNKSAWITLILSSIILVPFTIYLFIFYSSVAYSAFFETLTADDLASGNILTIAILNANAIKNAYNDGFAELIFILFMPIIFLAFGFVLNKWENEDGWLKYFKIPFLIGVAFLFDTLLAYKISEQIYNLNALTSLDKIPPFSMSLAFQNPNFWVVICLGFVSYLIWGFVFGFLIKAWENLDLNPVRRKQIEERIETLKAHLKEEKQKCSNLKSELNSIDPKVKEIETQMSVSARYDIAKIKLELSNFFAGWQQHLAALNKSEQEKQDATNIFHEIINGIKIVE